MSNARERAMNALARMLAEAPETPEQETEMLGEVVDAITEHVIAKVRADYRRNAPHVTHRRSMYPGAW